MFTDFDGPDFMGSPTDNDGPLTIVRPAVRRLVDELRMSLHPELCRRLQVIDDHDWGPVRRKTRELYAEQGTELTEQDMDEVIYALKQYYAVAVADPINNHAVSAQVDLAWHAHMLHSKQYAQFSEDVAGRYIHHTPLNQQDGDAVESVRQLYGYTLEVLLKLFRTVNPRLWPDEGSPNFLKLLCAHNKDYPEINQYAAFPYDTRSDLFRE